MLLLFFLVVEILNISINDEELSFQYDLGAGGVSAILRMSWLGYTDHSVEKGLQTFLSIIFVHSRKCTYSNSLRLPFQITSSGHKTIS
jgi:hypothetical protein